MLAIIVLCFAAGALNHARDFVVRGWRPYAVGSLPFECFWSALILFDLAVVVLLLAGWRRGGLALALAVMVADVAVNVAASHVFGDGWYGGALVLQALFLGFVAGSIGFLWPPPARDG